MPEITLRTKLVVAVLGVGALIVFGGAWIFLGSHENGSNQGATRCTQEARVCSDGTVVTRTGPDCSFAECPNDRIKDLTPPVTEDDGDLGIRSEPIPPALGDDDGDTPVACTADAKQCPDGSYVGRTGPNCEFVCPTTPPKGSITVSGSITVGPMCPVMRIPPEPECNDKPYSGTIVLTNTSTGDSYDAVSDENGSFTITLPRGVYDVSRPPHESLFPYCSGKIEILNPGSPIPISCDTGIR